MRSRATSSANSAAAAVAWVVRGVGEGRGLSVSDGVFPEKEYRNVFRRRQAAASGRRAREQSLGVDGAEGPRFEETGGNGRNGAEPRERPFEAGTVLRVFGEVQRRESGVGVAWFEREGLAVLPEGGAGTIPAFEQKPEQKVRAGARGGIGKRFRLHGVRPGGKSARRFDFFAGERRKRAPGRREDVVVPPPHRVRRVERNGPPVSGGEAREGVGEEPRGFVRASGAERLFCGVEELRVVVARDGLAEGDEGVGEEPVAVGAPDERRRRERGAGDFGGVSGRARGVGFDFRPGQDAHHASDGCGRARVARKRDGGGGEDVERLGGRKVLAEEAERPVRRSAEFEQRGAGDADGVVRASGPEERGGEVFGVQFVDGKNVLSAPERIAFAEGDDVGGRSGTAVEFEQGPGRVVSPQMGVLAREEGEAGAFGVGMPAFPDGRPDFVDGLRRKRRAGAGGRGRDEIAGILLRVGGFRRRAAGFSALLFPFEPGLPGMVEQPLQRTPKPGIGPKDGRRVERGKRLARGGSVAVEPGERERQGLENRRRVRRAAGDGCNPFRDSRADLRPAVGVGQLAQERQQRSFAAEIRVRALHREESAFVPGEKAEQAGPAVHDDRTDGQGERGVERGEPVAGGRSLAGADARGAQPRLGEQEAVDGGDGGRDGVRRRPFVRDGGEQPRGAVQTGRFGRGGLRGGGDRRRREEEGQGAKDGSHFRSASSARRSRRRSSRRSVS